MEKVKFLKKSLANAGLGICFKAKKALKASLERHGL